MALKTMTDWVHGVINHPSHIAIMKQEGSAQPTGVLSKLIRYEKLRWYGNGTVQVTLFVLFLFSFLVNTIAELRYGFARLLHRQKNADLQASSKVLNFKRAVCALNLVILAAMQVTVLLVFDQIHPSCPTVLSFLPLLGTVSSLATIALLVLYARTCRDEGWMAARSLRGTFDVFCLILFVPYMFYWNLIGYRF